MLKKVGNKHRFVEKEKNGFCIPFFGQLHELLKMPEVQEDLSAETESIFPLLDFKDGLYHKKNTLMITLMLCYFVYTMMILKLLTQLDHIARNTKYLYFIGSF